MRTGRWGCWLLIALGAVLLLFAGSFPGIAVDWWWFDSLGQLPVYLLRFTTQSWLLLLVALVSLAFLSANILLARRFSLQDSIVVPLNRRRGTQAEIDLRVVTPIALAAAGFVSVIMGLSATDAWTDWLRFQNATPFGVQDPIHGLDVSFYVFQLPIYQDIVTWLLWLIAIGFVVTLLFYGGGRVVTAVSGQSYRGAGIRHLSILGALWLGLQAWSYLLHRYALLYEPSDLVSGPGYTAVNARMPADVILAALVALCILALLANLAVRRLVIVWAALAVWLGGSVLVSGIYPELVQNFVVKPNELTLEQPYIAHSIEFTDRAYKLDIIKESEYPADGQISARDVLSDAETISNIRLWDYRPLLTTFAQIQGIRRYYDFRDVDVEAYRLGGQLRQVMVAAREINVSALAGDADPSWINRHLIYTHGYGVAANLVSDVGPEGLPVLVVRDLPPTSSVPELNVTRPEIYFGEETTDYAIVDTGTQEFDYPSGDQNVYTTYAGGGGVLVSDPLRRLVFALNFESTDLLLSPSITADSRMLYHRALQERLQLLAPFLIYDRDPYISIVNGRLVWIQDAYTYDRHYPYSAPFVDPYPDTGRDKASIGGPDLNYVRNSVKVTVDAYDGTTTFYIADPQDPIIQTWAKIYPSLFVPLDRLGAATRAQLRYPEGMFRAQASMYATYHMKDARVFYNREDQWQIAQDLQAGQPQLMEPYYVVMRVPGRQAAEFVLMIPFTPSGGKQNMVAWLYADSDGPNLGEMAVFKFGKQALVYGPMQIEGRINQEPSISSALTLWNQQGSSVIRGNLLVIPVNGALLYVEPIYLQSESGRLPEFKRVVVAYRSSIAMAESLSAALQQVFGAAPPANEPPTGGTSTDVTALAQSAQQHYQRAQECLARSDWACYGAEQTALEQDLAALVAATKK